METSGVREKRDEGLRASTAYADRNERDENEKHDARHALLKIRRQANAAIIQKCEEQSQRNTEHEAPEKYGLASDVVDLDGIELRENVRRDFAERDRFPRAHDEYASSMIHPVK